MTQPSPAPTDPTPPANPAPPAAPPADPPAGGGPAGGERQILADLARERDKRQALETQLAALAPLQRLAESLTGGAAPPDGKTEVQLLTERLAQHETDLTTERQARWRAEIAAEKGISPQLAARLQGTTREELAADADALAALMPKPAPAAPGTPAPDPSQGARGGGADLDAQIKTAQAAGDWRTVIRLQNEKLANQTK